MKTQGALRILETARLREHGCRLLRQDNLQVMEMIDPYDSAKRRYHYARVAGIRSRRVLDHDGQIIEPWAPADLGVLKRFGGEFHPILHFFNEE